MILYLEDDAIVADIWSYDLIQAGYDVCVLGRHQELLEKLESPPFPVTAILLDMMLPPGDTLGIQETANGLRTGFVVIDKIREHYVRKEQTCVPIIAITVMSEYKEELDGMNVDVVLKRKDTPDRVLEILRKHKVAPDREAADDQG